MTAMARCVFIVQGEGRGHMSQSMALKEVLEEAGHIVEAVFAGCTPDAPLPHYFTACFGSRLDCMTSPFLLRSHNRKGILVGKTILYNLLRSASYLREVRRIRKRIREVRPDVVFNFYDPLGALALRKTGQGIMRIGIGHHFYLHLDGYRCRGGSPLHRLLLKYLSGLMIRSCDRVLALSFREEKGNERIRVIPPLIRKGFREIRHTPGERYLVYLLKEGYLYDLIRMARADPDFRADIFCNCIPETVLPPGLEVHLPDADKFRQKMALCRGMITTSGFDTVAEAAYLGIPLVVVPARNHFEQLCNSRDIQASGFGHAATELVPGTEKMMKTGNNEQFRRWVDTAPGEILKIIQP